MKPARLTATALVAVAAVLIHLDAAAAAPPPPAELRADEGDGWSPDPDFTLHWSNGTADVAAVRYQVEDPLGSVVVGPRRLAWGAQQVGVSVPSGPGAYTAEVWLEDPGGVQGAPAAVKLRYDATRPGLSEPIDPSGWIGRAELPYAVRITHPQGVPPVSGVRGYAVSIDQSPEGSPCASTDRCTDAETDLRGGVDDDSLIVDELPEGISQVHAVAVSGSGVRSATPGHATLRVDKTDPVTTLEGLPDGWSGGAVGLRATATDSASGMSPVAGGGAPFTAIRVDGGVPIVAGGASVQTTVIGSGAHTVAYYARDAAGNVDDGAPANGRRNAPPREAILRIDRDPPAVAFVGSAGPGDPEVIEARVTDALSGTDPRRGEIAVRRAGAFGPFRGLPTVGDGDSLRARWDSDAYPQGDYEFRATGHDAAGNAASTTRRLNGSRMILPSPLKARAILDAGLSAAFRPHAWDVRRPSLLPPTLSIRRGHGAWVLGNLVGTSDPPLGGRPVRIVERFDPGAPQGTRTTVVTTGESGRFAARLSRGPSRDVVATFAGTPAATRADSRRLRVDVRSLSRLRASAGVAVVGGRPLVFRGAVACSPDEVPTEGIAVQLQFRAPGIGWTELRTMRTDRRGRFRYAYWFSDDDSRGVRFRFRAFVPAQSDWPYEPGGSRPVAVRGA